MTTTYVTTDMTSGFSVAAEGDILDVLSTGIVSTTGTGAAVESNYGSEIDVLGTIAGGDYGLYSGANGQNSYIYIGATGSVLSAYYSTSYANVAVETTGPAFIYNYGQILASGSSGSGAGFNGQTEIVNHGVITGSADGITSYDSKATDTFTLDNYGAIDGGGSFAGRAEIDIIFNAGTMTGNISMGSATGGSIDNTGTIKGSINAANGTTITNSGVITGTVNLNGGAVNLDNAYMTLSGGGDTVTIGAGSQNDLTIGGNASGAGDVVNGKNAYVAVSAYSDVEVNGDADTVAIGAEADVGITGSNEWISFSGGTGSVATLFATISGWDYVSGSNATVDETDAQASIFGGDDTVNLSGAKDQLSLYLTNGNWDFVSGSNSTIYLTSSQASIAGGDDIVDLLATDDQVSLYATNGAWDSVNGSNATIYATEAQTNVFGGNDLINVSGTGDQLSLYMTSGAWDSVIGASATIYVTSSQSSISGGGNGIVLVGTGDQISLYSTNGAWDNVVGSPPTIYMTSSQTTLTGNTDAVSFLGTGNAVTANGGSEAFAFQAAFGKDTIYDFASSDTLQFSSSDWTSFQALQNANAISQSGADTLITLNASNVLTLIGVTATSLTASEFKFA